MLKHGERQAEARPGRPWKCSCCMACSRQQHGRARGITAYWRLGARKDAWTASCRKLRCDLTSTQPYASCAPRQLRSNWTAAFCLESNDHSASFPRHARPCKRVCGGIVLAVEHCSALQASRKYSRVCVHVRILPAHDCNYSKCVAE